MPVEKVVLTVLGLPGLGSSVGAVSSARVSLSRSGGGAAIFRATFLAAALMKY
jgi:hypothetical protein